MDWKNIRVASTRENVDEIEALLWLSDAVAVTLTPRDAEDLLEPGPAQTPMWETLTVTATFAVDADTGPLVAALAGQGHLFTTEAVEDRVWEREWLQYFRPLQFGPSFWVCPTGFTVSAPGATVMMLDPGLAFGTGTHATTALCLEWLANHDLSGRVVIDYGCGSGILGVAAALLGASRVVGVDNDPQALAATAANSARNNVLIDAQMPGKVLEGADVVVANILAGPLVTLRETLLGALRAGGSIVLSGIKAEQEMMLREAYEPHVDNLQVVEKDGWLCITATRQQERLVR